ncbi:AsmA family protein [candidate division GN15 bacterium]|nr:AsmA family protein [candidate division GN15 bacterium]
MNKFKKIVLWTLGVLVALVLLAMIGLKLFFPTEKVRQMAEEEGTAALNRDVTIESLDVSFWGGIGVVLKDVSVGSPADFEAENLIQAEKIDVKLQILPLLTGNYRVDRLIVSKPTISLVKTASGVVNYAIDLAAVDTTLPPEVREMPPDRQTAATVVSFDRLEINDGTLYYRDDSAGVTLDLTGFNLTTSLTMPSNRTYESIGELRADSIAISMDDERLPTYALELDYNAAFDMTRQELTINRGDVRLNTLDLSVTGMITDMLEAPQARLAVKTGEVGVADVFSLLPPSQREKLEDFTIAGGFSLTVDLEYYSDRTEDPLVYTGTAVITDMTMASAEIPGELAVGRALLDFKADNLRLALEQATFDNRPLKGHLVVDGFDDPRVSGELAGDVDLKFAEPFLPADHDQSVSGQTKFEIAFSGPVADPAGFDFSGTLSVTDGFYQSTMLPEPVETFTLDVYFDRGLVNVRSLNGTFPSGTLTFSGRINDLVPYLMADSAAAASISPEIDGSLSGSMNLAMANPLLPEKGAPKLTGNAQLDLQFAGSLTDLTRFRPRGSLEITEASYSDSLLPEPITYLAAGMHLTPDTIVVDSLRLKFESSDLYFAGKLVKPFPYLLPIDDLDRSALRRPLFQFQLTSTRLDIDKLFPEAVPGSAEEAEPSKSIDSVSMVFVPDIDGQGTLAVDTLVYNKMEFTDADGQIRIRDRKIDVYDVTAKLYSGDVSGKTVIDLNDFENPKYTGSFAFDQVQANDFMTRFTPFADHLFGTLNFTGSYNAVGWEPDQFLNSLTLDGNGEIKNGEIVTSGAVYQAINQLAEFVNESFDKEQTLKNLSTKIHVENGRVRLDQLDTELDQLGDLSLSGYYGFDGALDYDATLLLSEEMSAKAAKGLGKTLSGLLGGSSGQRLPVGFDIGGTVDQPKAQVDLTKLKEQVGENLLDQAGSKLKDLFD